MLQAIHHFKHRYIKKSFCRSDEDTENEQSQQTDDREVCTRCEMMIILTITMIGSHVSKSKVRFAHHVSGHTRCEAKVFHLRVFFSPSFTLCVSVFISQFSKLTEVFFRDLQINLFYNVSTHFGVANFILSQITGEPFGIRSRNKMVGKDKLYFIFRKLILFLNTAVATIQFL